MTTQAEEFWTAIESMDEFSDAGRESYWKKMTDRGVATPTTSSQTYRFADGSAICFGTNEEGDLDPVFEPARRVP